MPVILTNMSFWHLTLKCNIWESRVTQWTTVFQMKCMMLQQSWWAKYLFECKTDTWRGECDTALQVHQGGSRSHVAPNVQEWALVGFWCLRFSEEGIHSDLITLLRCSCLQPRVCVRVGFLNTLSPKQQSQQTEYRNRRERPAIVQ